MKPRNRQRPLGRLSTALGRLFVAAAMLVPLAPGCSDDDGMTLPPTYNTGRNRTIEINVSQPLAAPRDVVRPLNGVDGAPEAIVPGDPDLTARYWGRPPGRPVCTQSNDRCPAGLDCQQTSSGFRCVGDPCAAPEFSCGTGLQCICQDACPACAHGCQPGAFECQPPDGAHVELVRVGGSTSCGLALEDVFTGANPNAPGDFDFATLDKHMLLAATGLNTADVMWQAAFNPGETCSANGGRLTGKAIPTAQDGLVWSDVVVNSLRHLREDPAAAGSWHGASSLGLHRVRFVELFGDPVARMGYPTDGTAPEWAVLFATYKVTADKLKALWPDTAGVPALHVGGMSFEFGSVTKLEAVPLHPAILFMDYCQANAVALDFVSFSTRTARAYDAAAIAAKLRELLDARGFAATKLLNTGVAIADDDSTLIDSRCGGGRAAIAENDRYCSALLGSFQAAARVFMQDVPVDWALTGRGPRIYGDLKGAPILDSEFFLSSGVAKPAFMAFFPFRQITGHKRVAIGPGSADQANLAILASHAASNTKVLHVIIANGNVADGLADITYDLRTAGFLPHGVTEVDYKLAVLDQNSFGTGSFFFSELGKLEASEGNGVIRFVHQMAVPSLHYLQLSYK